MTAINPARLKTQVAELTAHYGESEPFIRRLHQLLNYYADRVRRPGLSGAPGPALPAYQVPQPVIRSVVREVEPLLKRSPSRGLLLVDALWEEDWLEMKTFAGSLLGRIPPLNAGPLIKRFRSWALDCQERQILQVLGDEALANLRAQHPEVVLSLVKELLSNHQRQGRIIALYILLPLARDKSFHNLPLIFQALESYLGKEEGLRKELVSLLNALIKRSPSETYFFLQAQFPGAAQPQMTRLIRGILPQFSPQRAQDLQEMIRK